MKGLEKYFPWFLILGILINANGLFLDILEPDGALYATISKHIALTGDWMNLFGDGHDWLDKPHLPFWITALSFKILGINSFAYKLPAFISWLAGTCFLYNLCKQLYDKNTAKLSVIVYVFSLHGILNNFDVRAEPYLTTFIIGSIYLVYQASVSGRWLHFILASLMAAGAVMTKGIFALITIGAGFIIYWIITRQWKQLLNYRWWMIILLILLFITPELYSLYSQFDLHPEKVVFGRTNVSGLKFFFWDSQFGRFFNTGPIKGNGEPTFFLHSTLWAFLPWSIILYIGVFNLIRNLKDYRGNIVWIVYGSAIVTFLLFSFSGFQLPHYIVILFPHFSIITAAYLISVSKPLDINRLSKLQSLLLTLGAIATCVLAIYSKTGNIVLITVVTLGIVITIFIYFRPPGLIKIISTSIGLSLVLFLFLFNYFYPEMLPYQAGMQAGKFITKNNIRAEATTLDAWSYSFEFYSPGIVRYLTSMDVLRSSLVVSDSLVVYTTENMVPQLQQNGFHFSVLKTFDYFHISMLTPAFLNPKTRAAQVERMALVLVRKQPL